MTDPSVIAINDARALLSTLLASDFQDVHVVSGGTEIFLARSAGSANPMRVQSAPAESLDETPVGTEIAVKAPHVATLCTTGSVGTTVVVGEQIAILSVLDKEFAMLAPVAGQIIAIQAALGSLVEFDQPILLLREIA